MIVTSEIEYLTADEEDLLLLLRLMNLLDEEG
jgi:hypothetical protein